MSDIAEGMYLSIPVLEFEHLHQQIRELRLYARHLGACDTRRLNDSVNRSRQEQQVLEQSTHCTCGLDDILAGFK